MLTPPSSERIEVGVDEVGRGCLSHSVVAAACVLPADMDMDHPLVAYIKDSKKVTEKKRKSVEAYIKSIATAWAIGEASVEEIDTVNILQATFIAMHRALDQVYEKVQFEHIIVDGPHFKPYLKDDTRLSNTCVPEGDAKYLCIAAASILAKCYRDDMVCAMVQNNPELEKYGFSSHKGYGTKKHLDALKQYGVTPHHRKSFSPVAAIVHGHSPSTSSNTNPNPNTIASPNTNTNANVKDNKKKYNKYTYTRVSAPLQFVDSDEDE